MSYNPKVVSIDRSPAYVHHRAMVNRHENNSVDALELMRRAVDSQPDNREYLLDLAEMYCEMGCHEQSARLLLDMLTKKDAPAECYYGLALNQLAMNDLEGAKRSLRLYSSSEPGGELSGDAGRLASELEIVDALNRPASRKLYRAMRIADRACELLQQDNPEGARRLFERSLHMASEQYEMRAMYALSLMMCGENDAAIREAEKASGGFPPSVRAMCAASQVFAGLDQKERAKSLLLRARDERPSGMEMRLLIFSMGELEMHEEIAECARLALQETPYDRQLLHIRATALRHCGTPDEQAEKFWRRILRIDPDDTVARFYRDACANKRMQNYTPTYVYQVPEEEFTRRAEWLARALNGGLDEVRARWSESSELRLLVRWAVTAGNESLSRVAVTVLSAMDDEESRSSVRTILFSAGVQPELKMHAASLLRMRGADMNTVFPANPDAVETAVTRTEPFLDEMLVGDRQLIRFAAQVLEEEYGVPASSSIMMMWSVYRRMRGLRTDPITSSEAASAALVYNYLLQHGKRPSIEEMAKKFGCSKRRLVFYAGRIAEVLDRK